MAETLAVTSVWLTCQQPARDQRKGRYVPETSSHPGKMLPNLAAHAISSYTAPGELVLDPMCGSGTTLVEAVLLGRDALGVDVEPRFTALAQANLDLAESQGAAGTAKVFTGDATGLLDLVPVQRCAAMLAAVRDGQIVHRASMFGLMAVRRARAEGIPVHLVAHEDVLVLRRC